MLGVERAKHWLFEESFSFRTKSLFLEELEGGLSFEVSLLSCLTRAPCTCGLTCFQMTSLRHHLSISSHDCLSGSTHRRGAGAGVPPCGGSPSLAMPGGMCRGILHRLTVCASLACSPPLCFSSSREVGVVSRVYQWGRSASCVWVFVEDRVSHTKPGLKVIETRVRATHLALFQLVDRCPLSAWRSEAEGDVLFSII